MSCAASHKRRWFIIAIEKRESQRKQTNAVKLLPGYGVPGWAPISGDAAESSPVPVGVHARRERTRCIKYVNLPVAPTCSGIKPIKEKSTNDPT
jgi:hypothetical protein